MLKDVLLNRRKYLNLSQEEVASKLNVSRQAVAKWESGKSVPDIYNCQEICKLYDMNISDLLDSDRKDLKEIAPDGKYIFGYIKIEEGGKITIPKECLEVMNYKINDYVICLADKASGIALVPASTYENFAKEILKAKECVDNGNNYNK